MFWNRKMRSICRETDRHLLKSLRRDLWERLKEQQWLAVRLFNAAGRPPDSLYSHSNCEDCEHFCEPEFCARCWVEAASIACEEDVHVE